MFKKPEQPSFFSCLCPIYELYLQQIYIHLFRTMSGRSECAQLHNEIPLSYNSHFAESCPCQFSAVIEWLI